MRLVPWLAKIDADILVLTEYKSGPLGDELKALLAHAGYPHFLSHSQGPFNLGTAIASKQSLKIAELPIPAASDHWRSIGVCVDDIDVFGFYFPLKEAKGLYWNWLLANAEKLRDRKVVLIGDFNTGKIRIDEAGESFDCQDKHEALERIGFKDTWRTAYPVDRDYTWYSSYGNGFRLDYIWASPSFLPFIHRVWHEHEARLAHYSDHSAVVADFLIPAGVSND